MADELTVRLQALDQTWEVGGADRARGVHPENVELKSNDWGPDTCRFTLRRDPGAIFPDLGAFTPCEVEVAGVVVWSGFVWETPTQEGADAQIGVEGRGWQYHLDDDVFQRAYVHSKLSEWVDSRSMPTCNLTSFFAAPQVTTDARLITIQVPNGTAVPAGGQAGVTLDFGEASNGPTRVVVEWESSTNGTISLYARASSSPNPADTSASSDPISAVSLVPASGTSAGTITTTRRYLHIFTYKAVGATYGADVWTRLNAIRCFRSIAYESSNASILKSSDVVRDLLDIAPLLSTDRSLVQSTSLSLPDFAMTEDRTPREVWEAANAPHRWVRKIGADRRPVFAPQPTVPKFRVGQWAGIEFKDASRSSGQEIYSRAAIRGQGADGVPIRVDRQAAQQTGVKGTIASEIAAYTTATLNAGALTGYIYTGTPLAGRTYRFTSTFSVASGTASLYWVVTVGTTQVSRWIEVTTTPTTYTLGIVVPPAPSGFVAQRYNAGAVNISETGHLVERVTPTMVDRRGFTRAKVVSFSPTINTEIGNSFGDAFLAAHNRSPLKGGFEAVGPAVRTYLGDAPVHPAHLLLHTTELVHLSHHVDPDTGHLGRDAPVVADAYTPDDRRAQVDVDASRENFEALAERFALLSG